MVIGKYVHFNVMYIKKHLKNSWKMTFEKKDT